MAELACRKFVLLYDWWSGFAGPSELYICRDGLGELVGGWDDDVATIWASIHDGPSADRLKVDLGAVMHIGKQPGQFYGGDVEVLVDGASITLANSTFCYLRSIAKRAGRTTLYVQFEYE